MKVLMVAPQPFFEPRGTPISVYQRLNGLSQLGYQVDLATYSIGDEIQLPGLTIHRAPGLPFIRELKVGPSWTKVPMDILLFFKVFALLLRNEYDVIHTHEEAALFSLPLTNIFKTRHLYDMHSSLPKQLVNFNFCNYKLIIKLFERLERLVIYSADAMITIGQDLEQHVENIRPDVVQVMIENLPLRMDDAEDEVDTIEGLIDRLEVHDNLTVVYTGTFERYQGIDLLIEAASIVADQAPNVVFILVGGKTNQVEAMKQLAKDFNIEKKFRFVGTVSVTEANRHIEMADILVSPRVVGTSVPLKIYTYLSAGKSILATNLKAHSLVLDEQTSILVEPSVQAVASGLLDLVRDPELRRRLGKKAMKLADEKYGLASYLTKLEHIYTILNNTSPKYKHRGSPFELFED